MKMKQSYRMLALVMIVLAISVVSTIPALPNDISVSNVAWQAAGGGRSYASFDVSWENSWRAHWVEAPADNVTGAELTVTNWDAAWVFVKFRIEDGLHWQHATLSTNASDHLAPEGAKLSVGLNNAGDKGIGVFLHRATNGHGNISFSNVRLNWLHEFDGVSKTNTVDLAVHAIEMVHVAEGPFKIGSGGSRRNEFYVHPDTATPYLVTGETAIPVGTTNGHLYYANIDSNGGDRLGPVPESFPKGYNSFYCMKYPVTQGQYAEFLNSISELQASYRFLNWYGTNRHVITGTWPNFTAAEAPDRACNQMGWTDCAAYAAWSGLRPMTELEYEKACRGPLNPVPDEYAWGSTTAVPLTGHDGVIGSGTETALPANANLNNVGFGGPVRVGIFAAPGKSRAESGASYWGIMELSGNLGDRPVTVGHSAGRSFQGTHGDGNLTAEGDASVATWPGTTATGTGFRGHYYTASYTTLCASERARAAFAYTLRMQYSGFRAIRSSP